MDEGKGIRIFHSGVPTSEASLSLPEAANLLREWVAQGKTCHVVPGASLFYNSSPAYCGEEPGEDPNAVALPRKTIEHLASFIEDIPICRECMKGMARG